MGKNGFFTFCKKKVSNVAPSSGKLICTWQFELGMHNFRKLERETLRVRSDKKVKQMVGTTFSSGGKCENRGANMWQILPFVPVRGAAKRRTCPRDVRSVSSRKGLNAENPVKVGDARRRRLPLKLASTSAAFWIERKLLRTQFKNGEKLPTYGAMGLWREGSYIRKEYRVPRGANRIIVDILCKVFPVDARRHYNGIEIRLRKPEVRVIREGVNRREKRQSWVTFFAAKQSIGRQKRNIPKAQLSKIKKGKYYAQVSRQLGSKTYRDQFGPKFSTTFIGRRAPARFNVTRNRWQLDSYQPGTVVCKSTRLPTCRKKVSEKNQWQGSRPKGNTGKKVRWAQSPQIDKRGEGSKLSL